MLRNYLLLAFKVLQRHKFYTFISLFGIAVTLMVLMVLTTLIESFVRPQGPERNSDQFLVGGPMMLLQRNADGQSRNRSTGLLGFRFVENYLLDMNTPELVSVFSGSVPVVMPGKEMVGFRDGVKIEATSRRTDANYWKILQFDFLEGRGVSQQEHEQGTYVVVISESMRDRFFDGAPALGKRITLDGAGYDVIGVVRDVSPLQTLAVADVWLPLFATPSTQFRNEYRGEFMVLLKARRPSEFPLIQQEYQLAVQSYHTEVAQYFSGERPTEVYSFAVSKLGFYLQAFGDPQLPPEQQTIGKTLFIGLAAGIVFFMLLPIINLVNINISRILDRASEIGVRKSFGASSGHLVRQFIVENMVVTLCGGVLGFALAVLMVSVISSSGLMPNERFQFNYRVFGLALLYMFVFGLLSSVYPAWKMSRLDPVHALKGQI